mgnify:CR=1 FL=1
MIMYVFIICISDFEEGAVKIDEYDSDETIRGLVTVGNFKVLDVLSEQGRQLGGLGDQGDALVVVELLPVRVDLPALRRGVRLLEQPARRPRELEGRVGFADELVFVQSQHFVVQLDHRDGGFTDPDSADRF